MVKTLFRRPLLPALALPLLFAPAPLPAQEGTAPYVVVESGRSFVRLQDAVDAIGDGQGTIRIAPGYHRDCAVQSAGRVAFVAAEAGRSEEHTSELQSLMRISYAVFCLKKKKRKDRA